MTRQLRSRIDRSAAAAVLLACATIAGGDTAARADRAPERPTPKPAHATAAANPLSLDALVFMACRDRLGVTAYLWCDADPRSRAARSNDESERPTDVDPFAEPSGGR
jgi:hypothetical protein